MGRGDEHDRRPERRHGHAQAGAQPTTFAPGGELFGIVSPPAASGAPGPVLQAATVADGQVLLRGAGCWDFAVSYSAAAGTGSSSAAQSSAGVVTGIPLATAEKLAVQSGHQG